MISIDKLTVLTLLGLVLTGCNKTYQALDVIPSGFLQDYSILEKGEGDQALYQYWRPGVQWEQYTKVIIDPVVIYLGENSQLNTVMQSERERLKELLARRIRDALKRDFHVVVRPGPEVIQLRVAITEAQISTQTVDVTSALSTAGNVLVNTGKMVSGDYELISSTSVEGEIIDSQTGQLLAAAVDRRVLGKSMFGTLTDWDEIDQNYQYWAERLQLRLCEKSHLAHCYD